MLWKLFIKNFAVIKELNLTLNTGLNVFTGQTGAGKSIVIDAICAVIGGRTKKELVRDNEKYATIIAYFTNENTKINDILNKQGITPEEGLLILERNIYNDGKSIAKVNSQPVSLSIIKEISQYLINIHGQNDTQILLNPQKHIEILDELCDNKLLLNEYREIYKSILLIKKERNSLKIDENEKQKKIDLLTYQIEEINNANLKLNEDEDLTSQKELMKNSEKIVSELSNAYFALSNEDSPCGLDFIASAEKSLATACGLYSQINPLFEKIQEILYDLTDVNSEISSILDSINFNSEILNDVEERLHLIDSLKLKYGKTIAEIVDFKEKAEKELEEISLSDEIIKNLEQKGKEQYTKLFNLAVLITNSRKLSAKHLEEKMSEELTFLDMPSTKLFVNISDTKLGANGKDFVEILISTNVGTTPKSISKIASGGELSRIMLSFKNALSVKDEISTMIFDEIDTGVSGKNAQKIGLKLKEAAKDRQILCVTHSAQVAALGEYQYLIGKSTHDDETFTFVEELNTEQRINEIARIMSTGEVSPLLLKTAKEMIKAGQKQL